MAKFGHDMQAHNSCVVGLFKAKGMCVGRVEHILLQGTQHHAQSQPISVVTQIETCHLENKITPWPLGQMERGRAFWKEGNEENTFDVGQKLKQNLELLQKYACQNVPYRSF